MRRMWQNYVDKYNKLQWWLSGVIYGFFIGKFFAEVRTMHSVWNDVVYEDFTWPDAVRLTWELKLGLVNPTSDDELMLWLLNQGYSFPDENGEGWQERMVGGHDLDDDLSIPGFLQT